MEQLHIGTDKGLMTNSVIINPSHLAPRTWTEKPQQAKEEVLNPHPKGTLAVRCSRQLAGVLKQHPQAATLLWARNAPKNGMCARQQKPPESLQPPGTASTGSGDQEKLQLTQTADKPEKGTPLPSQMIPDDK